MDHTLVRMRPTHPVVVASRLPPVPPATATAPCDCVLSYAEVPHTTDAQSHKGKRPFCRTPTVVSSVAKLPLLVRLHAERCVARAGRLLGLLRLRRGRRRSGHGHNAQAPALKAPGRRGVRHHSLQRHHSHSAMRGVCSTMRQPQLQPEGSAFASTRTSRHRQLRIKRRLHTSRLKSADNLEDGESA